MKPKSLRKYSKHLHYEIKMMQECFQLLQKPLGNKPLEYALLESFLIHTRVICDFLFGFREKREKGEQKKEYSILPNSDDVVARDYFPEWNPRRNKFLGDIRFKINKVVAHLTEKRLPYTKWDTVKIHNELIHYLQDFIQRTPKTMFDKHFDDLNLSQISDVHKPVAHTTVFTTNIIMHSSVSRAKPNDDMGSKEFELSDN